ncbi:MAG: acyltransferase family protein [Oscillospiraceae bacterium]|nr:acyltransferase family protein [Oscillospiraceae bacterium]
MAEKKARRTEFDILRLAAVLAVIMTHACGGAVKELDIFGAEWTVLNCLRSAVTWDVPVFVMMSGYLFLRPEKEISIKQLYTKYIKHLLICFFVWSAVYQAYYVIFTDVSLNWKGIASQFLIGPYPFWYLYMQIGLYMIVPFLRKIAENKKTAEYFIILFVLAEFVANYGAKLPFVGAVVEEIFKKMHFDFMLGFSGYYVLGCYLTRYPVSKKIETALYVAGACCVVFACVGTTWQSKAEGKYNEWFSKYLMPNVIIESAAVFTLFTKRISKIRFKEKTQKAFKMLSEAGLGVYLVHALIIELLSLAGISVSKYGVLSVIPISLTVYAVSLLLTLLIRKIPKIGKMIS